ncbi:MAG TPA: cytochrome P450 [Pseudonocardiaceae bacterium]|jgi:cytochrome P450|nr:cytochrome P450 [Pseudonocardiaceae bacterium]
MRRTGLDPDLALAELRERSPVSRLTLPNGSNVWLVTSHSLIREVLGAPDTFGNNGAGWSDPANGGPVPSAPQTPTISLHGDITEYDPPEHTKLRRLLAPAFGVGRVKAFGPLVARIVEDCLDGMARAAGPADLVEHFSMPIPLLTICELLGVPYADRSQFQRRSLDRLDNSLPHSVRAAAVGESRTYMAECVARARVRPGAGLISALVREHGDDITDRELIGLADILLISGYETTANILGLGTLLLLRHPEHWVALRENENIDGIIEELVRYLSPVQTGMVRVARRDVVLAGNQVLAGERLLCSLPSGNRDATALGPGLDTFDPDRNNRAHLGFGYGIHYCLGASLARMEMRAAYPALAKRFPALRPALPVRASQFRRYSAVFGLDSLPVEW